MADDNGAEAVDLQQLAAQMLGLNQQEETTEVEEDESLDSQPAGHPAWQEILNKIPKELHDQVIPTLQQWDAGVSRRFQKIHDEYAPYKDFIEEYDPDAIREAVGVYQALNNDPASTWETIGRVYGLSPQSSQANSSDEEDIDFDALPASIKNRLAKIDQHENVLEAMSKYVLDTQASQEEAQEDQELEELLEELAEEYGEFDEDYVVGLIAGGIDPEEAVARFQQITQQYSGDQQEEQRQEYPQVMSSGGGFPNMEQIDVKGLSNQDTQTLITELLRLSQDS